MKPLIRKKRGGRRWGNGRFCGYVLGSIAAALLFTASVGPVWAAGGDEAARFHPKRYVDVQILGINDFHGQLNVTQQVKGKPVGRADYLGETAPSAVRRRIRIR